MKSGGGTRGDGYTIRKIGNCRTARASAAGFFAMKHCVDTQCLAGIGETDTPIAYTKTKFFRFARKFPDVTFSRFSEAMKRDKDSHRCFPVEIANVRASRVGPRNGPHLRAFERLTPVGLRRNSETTSR